MCVSISGVYNNIPIIGLKKIHTKTTYLNLFTDIVERHRFLDFFVIIWIESAQHTNSTVSTDNNETNAASPLLDSLNSPKQQYMTIKLHNTEDSNCFIATVTVFSHVLLTHIHVVFSTCSLSEQFAY